MTWYERIRQKLEELGWSGAHLARKAEIEPKTLYKYLEGKIEKPRGKTLERLAKELGTTEQWLLYGIDEPEVIYRNSSFTDPNGLQVPIIDDKIFVGLVKGDYDYNYILSSSNHMPFIKKDSNSNELVLIKVRDNKNSPDLNSGDMVFIDLKEEPEHGDYVVAVIEDKVVIALYTMVLDSGKPVDVLHFTNNSLPDLYLDQKTTEHLYSVTAFLKYRR